VVEQVFAEEIAMDDLLGCGVHQRERSANRGPTAHRFPSISAI
jgi:hypothetical protein